MPQLNASYGNRFENIAYPQFPRGKQHGIRGRSRRPVGDLWVVPPSPPDKPKDPLPPWVTPAGAWGPPEKPPFPGARTILGEAGDNCGFVASLSPLLRAMQLSVVLPVHTDIPNGQVSFRWLSPIMVYSVVVYVIITASVLAAASYAFRHFVEAESVTFDEEIYAMTPLMMLHPHILLPVLYWREAPRVAEYLNAWTEFEVSFAKAAKRPLNLNLRGFCKGITAVCTVAAFLQAGTLPLYMPLRAWHAFAFAQLALLSSLLLAVWRVSGTALSRAALALRAALERSLSAVSTDADAAAETIADFRLLWLRLSDLTQHSGRAWTYSCGHQLLYQFLVMTVTTFGVLTGVSQHALHPRTLSFMALATYSGITLYVVCAAAEEAADQVADVLREDLLATSVHVDGQLLKNEIQMFMTALTMNPPSVNLSGYAIVNRALFASLLETMVTYLVVLVQFAYSLDSTGPTSTSPEPSTEAITTQASTVSITTGLASTKLGTTTDVV